MPLPCATTWTSFSRPHIWRSCVVGKAELMCIPPKYICSQLTFWSFNICKPLYYQLGLNGNVIYAMLCIWHGWYVRLILLEEVVPGSPFISYGIPLTTKNVMVPSDAKLTARRMYNNPFNSTYAIFQATKVWLLSIPVLHIHPAASLLWTN